MRLLFVDDDQEYLNWVESSLEEFKDEWELVFVGSGMAALKEIERAPFCAVISALHMPDMDGAMLLRKVRDEHPDVVRIVMSDTMKDDAPLRATAVAHQFVLKRCEMDELLRVIFRSCELHALIRGAEVCVLVEKIGDLPVQPKIYGQLMLALGDPGMGLGDVGEIVEKDVAISAKLLAMANSSRFPMRTELQTVQHAISFMGARMVASVVLSLEVAAAFPVAKHTEFSLDSFNDHSSLVGVIARDMFENDRLQGDDAFVAGMMHDVGKLMMASRLPRERELVDVPGSVVTHGALGALLLSDWGFRYPVVQGVAFHHEPSIADDRLGIATALHVADAIAHEIEGKVSAAEELLDMDHLELIAVDSMVDRCRHMAAELI